MAITMSYYKKMTIWQNRKRVKLLADFKELVATYFNNLEHSNVGDTWENEKAKEYRSEINRVLDKAHSSIISAGISPRLCKATDELSIDLINDMFSLGDFHIGPQRLLDIIERAIGKYEDDRLNARLRIINPLFYIGLILEYIVSLPFWVFGKIGLDQEKIESSIPGRIVRGILYLVPVLAALLAILEKKHYLLALIQCWINK